MPSSVPSVLSKLLATLIALLAFPLAVGARLVLGPTGVEYVKRFEPSTAADPCFFGCPTYGSAEVAPLSLEGTDLGSTTRCDYTVDGSPVSCTYDDGTGEYIGSDVDCAPGAFQRGPTGSTRGGTCGGGGRGGGGRRRRLSRLETVVQSRQYKVKRQEEAAPDA